MTLYDTGVAPLAEMLTHMAAWLDKARAGGADEAALMAARLAPDMHPLPRQFQIAADMAKNGAARLAGTEAPSMPDDEADFAGLQARCARTADFIRSVDREAVDAAAGRTIDLSFPNGMAFSFTGAEYVTYWVLPNVYFHAATAYGLLRAGGVELGKADFLASGARFARPRPAAAV